MRPPAIDYIKDRTIKKVKMPDVPWDCSGNVMFISGSESGVVDWSKSRFYDGSFWFMPVSGSRYVVLDTHQCPRFPKPPDVKWGPTPSPHTDEDEW